MMDIICQAKFNFQKFYHKYPKLFYVFFLFLSTVFVFSNSYLNIFLVLFIFGGSFCLGLLLINQDYLFPNLLWTCIRDLKKDDGQFTLVKSVCPICGKDKCNRHRPELNFIAFQPWLNLNIPEKINDAVEDFFNIIFKEFIYSWYSDLSQDESFVDEIKGALRFVVSILLRRIQKVDLSSFIIHKLLKITLKHLNYCIIAAKKENTSSKNLLVTDNLEKAILKEFGHHLHCATRSRKYELDYLKQVTDQLLPHLLPPHSLKSKSFCSLIRELFTGAILLPCMDILADPDIINNLLLLFFDDSLMEEFNDPASDLVPILNGYNHSATQQVQKNLQLKLSSILADPELLFPFMQFMKSEASVNVLQFYLVIEEFNRKVLTPELSDEKLIQLHNELKEIHKSYFDQASNDCIRFDKDICEEIKSVCQSNYKVILKLQTTTPLFRSYEQAYDLLEHTFLKLFHQSDIYYTMLCGERNVSKLNRSNSKMFKKNNDSISRLGSKIKGVFKGNTDSRSLVNENEYCLEEISETSPNQEFTLQLSNIASPMNEHNIIPTNPLNEEIFNLISTGYEDYPIKDLTSLKVTIPSIFTKSDSADLKIAKKFSYAFKLEIHQFDPMDIDGLETDQWTIERRYHEFYVLETKLKEFHGEFEDTQLPPKKTFLPKNKIFFETLRPVFEDYLKVLLSKPNLKGSQLLNNFLTLNQEFNTNFLDVNLGKKVKSGAMKLVKERGQHLDPFLKSFLLSTESPKSKPSRNSDKDPDCLSISSEKMQNSLYNYNVDIDSIPFPIVDANFTQLLEQSFLDSLKSVYDSIIYLTHNLFQGPFWLMKLLFAFRIVFRNTLDTFIDWYLDFKIKLFLNENNIVKIIYLLKDALFFDNSPLRTDEEKKERQINTLNEITSYIPKIYIQVVGDDNYKNGIKFIFEMLQMPRLNKQLAYSLLDNILEELFPELKQLSIEEDELQLFSLHNQTL